jgi:PhnB protein
MAKAAKKKAKASKKKSARMTVRSRAPKKSAKPVRKKVAKKSVRKIDPLNRKQYTSVTPMLTVRDIRQSVHFYVDALGFKVRGVMDGPEGPMHAELRLRDTTLMLGPESREQRSFSAGTIGDTPCTLYMLVENVDSVFDRAVAAGARVAMPVMNMFWGDRCGMLIDPDGNKWMIATHKAQPTPAQMRKAMESMAAQMSQGGEAAMAATAGSESEY